MRFYLLALCACLSFFASCNPQSREEGLKVPVIAEQSAVQIATEDARKSGFVLDRFDITAAEKPDGWHIEFELKDKRANGGGPSYVLDKETGKILRKVIYQ